MVKNTKGGSGAKSQASKYANAGKSSYKIRKAVEGEKYAFVTAILGNRMAYVHCHDGVVRLCHIRGKFCGRGKGDNFLSKGTWCLVGLRDFETPPKDKPQNCDLLEVYKITDKQSLVDGSSYWREFLRKEAEISENTTTANDSGLDIEFSIKGNGYEEDVMEFVGKEEKKKEAVIAEEEEQEQEEINIDDI
jgi:translation initiation factor 1A